MADDGVYSPNMDAAVNEKAVHTNEMSHDNSHESVDKIEDTASPKKESALAIAMRKELADPNVHQHMNMRLFLSLVAMSFLWIGSQIPLYLYGSVLTLIYSDIGGADGKFIWMIVGYFIPNAALCPFVGALSDMFGRKIVAATGQLLLIIAPIIVSTCHSMNVAIIGMALAGAGAGLNEMIALSGTSELVPIRKRPVYVTGVVSTILPFAPSILWAELIASASNWRWVGLLVGLWNFLGLILVVICYHDPLQDRPNQLSKMEVIRQVDFVGGFLSIGGATTFLVGLQFGAQNYSWTSAHVLVPLLVGAAVVAAFFVWEKYYAKYPMVPKELFSKDKRTMIAILVISFFSGAGFTGVILFWPPQSYNVYGLNQIDNGLRGLPVGFGIVAGACVGLLLLSSVGIIMRKARGLMIFWTVFMTAFLGAMSAARTDNLGTTLAMVTLASFGVGGVILPVSVMSQIVAPTELIGTISALVLSLRYLGGSIAFSTFFNIFYAKYNNLAQTIGLKIAQQGICGDYKTLVQLIDYASYAEYKKLEQLIAESPVVHHKDTAYDTIFGLVREGFASAYRWPWWISIAFGGSCVVASFFIRDIRKLAEQMV